MIGVTVGVVVAVDVAVDVGVAVGVIVKVGVIVARQRHGRCRRERRAVPSRAANRPEDRSARCRLHGGALTAHGRCAASRQRALAAVVDPGGVGRGGRLRRGVGYGGGGCNRRRRQRACRSKRGAGGSHTGREENRTTASTARTGILKAPTPTAIATRKGRFRRCRRGRRCDARSEGHARADTGRAGNWCAASAAPRRYPESTHSHHNCSTPESR